MGSVMASFSEIIYQLLQMGSNISAVLRLIYNSQATHRFCLVATQVQEEIWEWFGNWFLSHADPSDFASELQKVDKYPNKFVCAMGSKMINSETVKPNL